ncbi:DinB family protein [Ideonella sp.]|uniref:DinB family protein n=1 Tax=Ideonella sp. TaxID=1929293 RepID=UPI0035B2D481
MYTALLATLEEMPKFLRHALAGVSREALLRMPANDRSHLLEHLWHTRDCDTDLYGLRVRRILREDRPQLEPVDVVAWLEARGYESREGDQAIAEFEHERASLLSELRALTPAQLARVGIRADGTEVSVLDIIQQLALHDQDHRQRVATILRGFMEAAVPA